MSFFLKVQIVSWNDFFRYIVFTLYIVLWFSNDFFCSEVSRSIVLSSLRYFIILKNKSFIVMLQSF
jgi:hypothetical protein